MHILILPSSNYQTLREPLGGIFQYHQAHALRRNGFQVGVISSGLIPLRFSFTSYPYSDYETDQGIHVYRNFRRQLLPERVARRLQVDVNLRLQLQLRLKLFRKYIDRHGVPDVIHAHDCIYAGYIANEMKKTWHVPYVVTEHSGGHVIEYIPPRQRVLIRAALVHADVRTVVSAWLGELLTNLYGLNASQPLINIGNILDKHFESALEKEMLRQMAGPEEELFSFLNVASFDDNKAHRDLFAAFAKSFRHDKRIRLKVVGDGPLRSVLLQHVKGLGIEDQVSFLGEMDRAAVLSQMLSCNAFVLSSYVETFGVALIEALACGKPVIATACGGPKEFVGELNGILVPPKNIDALAEGMKQVLLRAKTYDPMAIRSDCVGRFGEAAFVERLRQLYLQAINNSKQ